MKEITKIILKDKEITDLELVGLVVQCLGETGGISDVNKNLSAIGYGNKFSDTAYPKLHQARTTGTLDLSAFTSNQLLVICIVIFATVKDVEHDTLIITPFDEGIELLRNI